MSRRQEVEWVETQATVTACKQTFQSSFSVTPYDGESREYIVRFSYCVKGRLFQGKYRVNSPLEVGHQFRMSYDPDNPKRNSADYFSNPYFRIAVSVGGAILAGLVIWLTRDQQWMPPF